MIRLSDCALAAALLGWSAIPASATTFVFYETSCAPAFYPGACSAPPTQPLPVFSLTISAPTETGSAVYGGFYSPPPVVSDTGFTFEDLYSSYLAITATDFGYFGEYGGFANFVSISWDAINGQLNAVAIDLNFEEADTAHVGLTGGLVWSNHAVGTCVFAACELAGFWQDPVPVPEPGSGLLFLSALVLGGVCVRWRTVTV